MIGCCCYCSDSEEQRVHVLKLHITVFFFSLLLNLFLTDASESDLEGCQISSG